MAKNLYNLTAVTTVNDSDLLHVNQGSVSSDKKVTKQNLLKEVNSSITSLNNSLTKSYGDVTKASNITNLEGWYAKDGQVCSFYASATAGAVFTGGADVLLSGLPIPKYGRIQGSGVVTSGGSFVKSLRVAVNSSGELTLWYGGNLASGDVITVQMCYVIA